MNLAEQYARRPEMRLFIWKNIVTEKGGTTVKGHIVYMDTSVENVRQRALKQRKDIIEIFSSEIFSHIMTDEPTCIEPGHGFGWFTNLNL